MSRCKHSVISDTEIDDLRRIRKSEKGEGKRDREMKREERRERERERREE